MTRFEMVQTSSELEAWAIQRIVNPNPKNGRAWRFRLVQSTGQWRLVPSTRAGQAELGHVQLSPQLADMLTAHSVTLVSLDHRRTRSAAEIIRMALGPHRAECVAAEAEEAAFRCQLFTMAVRRLWDADVGPSTWEAQTHPELGGRTYRSAVTASPDALRSVFALLRPQLAAVEPWSPRAREIASEAVAALGEARWIDHAEWWAADDRAFFAMIVAESACEAVGRALRHAHTHRLQDLPCTDELWPDETLLKVWWALERAHGGRGGASMGLERLARYEYLTTQLRDFAMAEILSAPASSNPTIAPSRTPTRDPPENIR